MLNFVFKKIKLQGCSELHVPFAMQATNLRSFQLLQEYLNAAGGGNTSSRFSYHFEFFIKGPSDDEAKDDKALQRVEVSLPPPQVKFHPQRGAEMLPGTKVAIGKLFAACGLSSEVSQGWVGDYHVSLSDFFQQASELQRKDASVLNREQQVIGQKPFRTCLRRILTAAKLHRLFYDFFAKRISSTQANIL